MEKIRKKIRYLAVIVHLIHLHALNLLHASGEWKEVLFREAMTFLISMVMI